MAQVRILQKDKLSVGTTPYFLIPFFIFILNLSAGAQIEKSSEKSSQSSNFVKISSPKTPPKDNNQR
jgi:hypothetical protein